MISTRLNFGAGVCAMAAAAGVCLSIGLGPDTARQDPRQRRIAADIAGKQRQAKREAGFHPHQPPPDNQGLRAFCAGGISSSPGSAIDDLGTTTDTFATGGVGAITDLNVELNIQHTWQGDLIVTLSNGIHTATLVNRPDEPNTFFGFSADNFGNFAAGNPFVLDDQAIPAQTYDTPQVVAPGIVGVTGSWLPDLGPLSVFNGDPLAATWTLTVSDNAGGDAGVLQRWGLCATPPFAPPAPTGSCCVGANCSITTQANCTGTWTLNGTCTFGPDGSPNPPYARNPNIPIPDNTPAGITDVANVAATYIVGHMTVHVNIPDHTFLADIAIKLTSPSATVVTLWSHQCGGDDGITCDFDDTAAVVVCPGVPATPVTGSIKPFSPLSAFRGQPVNGNWTLNVADTANIDIGTLVDWSMTISPAGPSTTCPDCFTHGPNTGDGACSIPPPGSNHQVHTRPLNAGHFARGGGDGSGDTTQCIGDWDGDGCVTPADVALFVASWFFSASNPGNLDGDMDCSGVADPADVASFVTHWFNGLNTPPAEGCV